MDDDWEIRMTMMFASMARCGVGVKRVGWGEMMGREGDMVDRWRGITMRAILYSLDITYFMQVFCRASGISHGQANDILLLYFERLQRAEGSSSASASQARRERSGDYEDSPTPKIKTPRPPPPRPRAYASARCMREMAVDVCCCWLGRRGAGRKIRVEDSSIATYIQRNH